MYLYGVVGVKEGCNPSPFPSPSLSVIHTHTRTLGQLPYFCPLPAQQRKRRELKEPFPLCFFLPFSFISLTFFFSRPHVKILRGSWGRETQRSPPQNRPHPSPAASPPRQQAEDLNHDSGRVEKGTACRVCARPLYAV